MQVNGINTNYNSRPAFQARIPQELQNNILRQAVEFGTEGLNNAKNKLQMFKDGADLQQFWKLLLICQVKLQSSA